MPKAVVNGLVAEEVHCATSTSLGIEADPQVALDQLDGGEIRLGRRPAAVQEDSLAAQRLELETDR